MNATSIEMPTAVPPAPAAATNTRICVGVSAPMPWMTPTPTAVCGRCSRRRDPSGIVTTWRRRWRCAGVVVHGPGTSATTPEPALVSCGRRRRPVDALLVLVVVHVLVLVLDHDGLWHWPVHRPTAEATGRGDHQHPPAAEPEVAAVPEQAETTAQHGQEGHADDPLQDIVDRGRQPFGARVAATPRIRMTRRGPGCTGSRDPRPAAVVPEISAIAAMWSQSMPWRSPKPKAVTRSPRSKVTASCPPWSARS